MKITFAAKRHSVHDNGNGSNGGCSGDDGCGGTADAVVILSVIIHMYIKIPQMNLVMITILLRVLHDYNGNLEKDTTMLIPTYVNTTD